MHPILWALIIVAGSTFWVYISFLALCTAKKLLISGIELPRDLKLTCLIALAVGYPSDIIYNFTRGFLMFGQFRGLTFSSRIKRYYKSGWKCPRPYLARRWFYILEGGDPGHIT